MASLAKKSYRITLGIGLLIAGVSVMANAIPALSNRVTEFLGWASFAFGPSIAVALIFGWFYYSALVFGLVYLSIKRKWLWVAVYALVMIAVHLIFSRYVAQQTLSSFG